MNTQEKIDILKRWFVHKTDTYVRQWEANDNVGYARVEEPLTDAVLVDHLVGRQTISSYPIDADDTVKWMCFDVDINGKGKRELSEEDVIGLTQQQTKRVAAVLFHNGIPFRVERSGSKGYHLWVFFESPIPTSKAYDVSHFLHTLFPINAYVNVEIIPQHRSLAAVNYSRAVKLPLGIHKKTGVRCFFVQGSFEPYENQWDVLQNIRTIDESAIDDIIKKHHITPEPTVRDYVDQKQDYLCFSSMMQEGLEDGERDLGIFQLACYYRIQNIPPDMADILLNEVNNKSPSPLDAETLLRKRVSAYDRKYYPSPCREPALDRFCSSQCKRWDRKVQSRWTRYGRRAEDAKGIIGS